MKDLIQKHGEKLFTTSLAIADEFGRRHDNVVRRIQNLADNGGISLLNLKERDFVNNRGRKRIFYEIPEREALIIMPFIGGSKSIQGQVILVDAFIAARKELNRLHKMQASPDWKQLRKDTKEAFKFVNLALTHMRELEGKMTKPYHYMNEAKLMNAVITGEYKGVDRESLTSTQLDLLTKIEMENSKLLLAGKTYNERKQNLLDMFIPKLN